MNPIPGFTSILVCTFNRSAMLERALRSLMAQTMRNDKFEIVVVDDGSTDATRARCQEMAKEAPNLRYVDGGPNQGVARARDLGVAAARGDRVLFIDDDCVADAHWAERMCAALERADIVAGAVDTETKPFMLFCHNVAQFGGYMSCHRSGECGMMAGANMGMRRSAVEKIGFTRFAQHAEDVDFALRAREAGYRLHFEAEAVVTHLPNRTAFTALMRYAADHADSMIRLRMRHAQLLRTPFLLRSPALLVLGTPIIALKVTAGIYLYNRVAARRFWSAPIVFATKVAWCVGAVQGLRAIARESAT